VASSEKAAAMMDAIQKAAKALAQLSDAEWMQVKRAENLRRVDQRIIRDLSQQHRELRDRKMEPATRRRSNASALALRR